MQASPTSYNAVAKALHWLMALLIVGMLVLGLVMTTGDVLGGPGKSFALQMHKSFGMIVLVLGLFRLVWRWLKPPPPFPAQMPRWEKFAAHVTHVILYVLML